MLTELRDGVWWLDCTGVNVYLVEDGDGLTVVDTGTPFDAARIEAGIDQAGFARADVERILLTHYDVDHVGAAATLAVDAPIYIGRGDVAYATGDERPPLRGSKTLIQLLGGPFVRNLPEDRVRPVDDSDSIGGFTAVHTPGHTPGHTVYLHEDRDAAFLGDAVMERNGSLRPSPWVVSYDTREVERSLRDLETRAGDFEVAAMGHGLPFGRRGGERLRETVAAL